MIHVLMTVEPVSPTLKQCRLQQRDFDGPPLVSYDSRPPQCSAGGDNVVSMIHVLMTVEPMSRTLKQCRLQQREFDGPLRLSTC